MKKYIEDIANKLSLIAEGDMNQTMDIQYLGEFLPIQKSLIRILDSPERFSSKDTYDSKRSVLGL